MSNSLLSYYDRELEAIKRLAAEFADTHPKIAGRLRLSADAVDDPHVARLLEGVAFLAARVHHRLDDEFPELTDALLGLLYPHYLAPVPSCMVAQFDCQPDLHDPGPAAGRRRDRNRAGATARRCASAPPRRVTLWPIEVENVRLSGLPLVAPANPPAAGAVGVLRITLKCASPEATFTQLGVDRLRFFLRGPANQTLALYELLGAHAISVAYADSAVDPAPVIVPATAIEPVGFAPEEALLPWSARGFSGFRLLTEYFAFPEKFLFVDFTRMDAKTLVSGGNRLEIFVYLDRASAGTGAHHRPAVAGARLHAAGQPVSRSAASRSRSTTWTPNTASCPTRAARARLRSGASSGCAKPSPTDRSVRGGRSTA